MSWGGYLPDYLFNIKFIADRAESGMKKLTQENVEKQTVENNEFDKMQADYNEVCESLRLQTKTNTELDDTNQKLQEIVADLRENAAAASKLTSEKNKILWDNANLIGERNKLLLEVQDLRENAAAARKLRKQHERQIKVMTAELEAANAWKNLEKAKLVQLTVNNKVARLSDECMELNAHFEELKNRYAPMLTSEQG